MAHEQPVLSIDVTDTAGTCTVVLAGEIDLSNSTQLSRELELIVSRPHPPAVIRIDLRDVTFMDSIGLAILLRARRDAELLRSRLTVCAVSPVIARLFEMSGLTGVLTEESA